MSEQQTSRRERRWTKDFDGSARTVIAEVEPGGFVMVSEQLVAEWMTEMGWREVISAPTLFAPTSPEDPA